MSYVSVLKNIPELLSQPAGIAAIASVGIHGAIAFILPLMPVDSESKQKTSPASVGIMELSQAEQNRLPQNKGPQVSGLPQVPQQALPLPNFATKPTPLAKLPPSPDSTKLTLPPLPKSSANPNISSLPKGQSLPVLRQPNFKVDSSFNAKAESGGSYRRSPKIKLGQAAPLVSRRNSLPEIPPIQSAPLPPELSGVPSAPPLPPNTNPGVGANSSVAINPQINPNVNNGVPANQPRRVNPNDFIAPTNRNIPKPGDKLTLAGTSLQQWGNQNQQQSGRRGIELPNQPSANGNTKTAPQNTTTLALAKQFEEVRGRYPNSEIKQPISEVIKTKPGKEGKVEGTLVIDSNGKADYLKFVDRSVSSDLKKEARNYFKKYFKENPIRKNGRAKVYAFTLDFKPEAVKTVEFSRPQNNLADRLRSSKKDGVQTNQKPSKKEPENISRTSAPVKIDAQPSPGAVVVPSGTSASVKPKPQARVNVKEPAPQEATSKPSLATRLRNGKEESEDDSEKTGSSKKLIQRLRKIQDRRENSN